MATKTEIIAALKLEYPEIKIGGGDVYETLSAKEYNATISEWADIQIAAEAAALQVKSDEIAKAAILAKIGITADELKIALS